MTTRYLNKCNHQNNEVNALKHKMVSFVCYYLSKRISVIAMNEFLFFYVNSSQQHLNLIYCIFICNSFFTSFNTFKYSKFYEFFCYFLYDLRQNIFTSLYTKDLTIRLYGFSFVIGDHKRYWSGKVVDNACFFFMLHAKDVLYL